MKMLTTFTMLLISNLVLSKAATCNKEAKLLFAKLDHIPFFFKVARKKMCCRSEVEVQNQVDYKSKTVLTVSINKQESLTWFNFIIITFWTVKCVHCMTLYRKTQYLETFKAAVNSIINSSSADNVEKSLSSLAKEVCDIVSFNIT